MRSLKTSRVISVIRIVAVIACIVYSAVCLCTAFRMLPDAKFPELARGLLLLVLFEIFDYSDLYAYALYIAAIGCLAVYGFILYRSYRNIAAGKGGIFLVIDALLNCGVIFFFALLSLDVAQTPLDPELIRACCIEGIALGAIGLTDDVFKLIALICVRKQKGVKPVQENTARFGCDFSITAVLGSVAGIVPSVLFAFAYCCIECSYNLATDDALSEALLGVLLFSYTVVQAILFVSVAAARQKRRGSAAAVVVILLSAVSAGLCMAYVKISPLSLMVIFAGEVLTIASSSIALRDNVRYQRDSVKRAAEAVYNSNRIRYGGRHEYR